MDIDIPRLEWFAITIQYVKSNCDRGFSLFDRKNSALLIEDLGHVRRLTLNRPDRLNAMTSSVRQMLCDALRDAAADDMVNAVILTGAGDRGFCAGQDLNESKELGDGNSDAWLDSWRRFFDSFATFPKPIVAAVNGVAAGGGFEIALLSHVRVAVPDARFLMAEINIGLPCIVGSFLLEQHVFFSRMVDLILTGRAIGAREAHQIGLVHRIAPPRRLAATALAMAEALAAKPRVAMQLNIRRFNALRRQAMERTGVVEALLRLQREAVSSGEPQQVMAAFLAERAQRKTSPRKGIKPANRKGVS